VGKEPTEIVGGRTTGGIVVSISVTTPDKVWCATKARLPLGKMVIAAGLAETGIVYSTTGGTAVAAITETVLEPKFAT